jgi:hypothetical protein
MVKTVPFDELPPHPVRSTTHRNKQVRADEVQRAIVYSTTHRIINAKVFLNSAGSVSQDCDLKFVATKLSLLTITGQRSSQGTKIQIPVNGSIKHGAHSRDTRQSLAESVRSLFLRNTMMRWETKIRSSWQSREVYRKFWSGNEWEREWLEGAGGVLEYLYY